MFPGFDNLQGELSYDIFYLILPIIVYFPYHNLLYMVLSSFDRLFFMGKEPNNISQFPPWVYA